MSLVEKLRPVLRHYPIVTDSPVAASAVSGGFSGANVYRIETAAGTFALRRWPPGSDRTRLMGLHELLRHLSDRGLNTIARPVASASGTTLVSQSDGWWQLEPWLPGRADYHTSPSRTRLSAAMQALAAWHLAAATYRGPQAVGPASAAIAPCVPERLQRLHQLTPQYLHTVEEQAARHPVPELTSAAEALAVGVRQLAKPITALLKEAQTGRVPLQFCLRDLWHDHVLFTGDAVTGLVDPSAARVDTVATDLSRLLGSLVEDDRAAWQHGLSVYAQLRPLSLAEESLIAVLDASGVVLSAATWLDWLGPQRRVFLDPASAIRRVDHLRRRLTTLVQRGGNDTSTQW